MVSLYSLKDSPLKKNKKIKKEEEGERVTLFFFFNYFNYNIFYGKRKDWNFLMAVGN